MGKVSELPVLSEA
jgi:hypothetical protein